MNDPRERGDDGLTIVRDASLRERNTFGVDARAAWLIAIDNADAIAPAFRFAESRRRPVLVLGAGSNVLLTQDWPGVVLSIATRGIAIVDDDGATARVRVAAGENWDAFVHWSLAQGFVGLENLVSIPGTVGAAPIQNIGAYGVEVCAFIARVEAWDRARARGVSLDREACAFGYRDSVFKRDRERYLITTVEFALPRRHALELDYAGVREELAVLGVDRPAPIDVATAIARIRARKLPDPARIGNAGSFFKNPLLDAASVARLLERNPRLPHWPHGDGRIKLSAAWLIEAAGMKGIRDGDAGISRDHALVLVNHGGASGAQLWALAARVRTAVFDQYAIRLDVEPLVVPGE